MITPTIAIRHDCQVLLDRAFKGQEIKVGMFAIPIVGVDVHVDTSSEDESSGEVVLHFPSSVEFPSTPTEHLFKDSLAQLLDQAGIDISAVTDMQVTPKSVVLKFEVFALLGW